MFKRKEENELESSANTPQGSMLGSDGVIESATVIPAQPSANPYGAASSQAGNASATAAPVSSYPGSTNPYGANAGAPRGAEANRPTPATPFRPTAGAAPMNSPSGMGAPEARRMPEARQNPGAGHNTANAPKESRRVLTVGSDILLKGEIATCDRLVIEGKVDATLNDVHTVEIAESGSFKGNAQIEYAEISGLFEGDLTVKNRLVIYATGVVRGKISYGEIEIERGGELSGEIKSSAAETQGYNRNRERNKEAA